MNGLALAALISAAPGFTPRLPPAPPAAPAPVYAAKSRSLLSEGALAARLARDRIVYVGERHDQPASHAVEAEVVRLLSRREPNLVVGLEMVDQSRQQVLDDYVSGAMSEADFAAFWRKEWGFPYSLYEPVLALCRARRIRLVALNLPQSVAHQIYVGGLSSLTSAQRRWLPKVVNPITDKAYKDAVLAELGGHGAMPPQVVDRMMQAMAAWNETMGQAVVDQVNAGKKVVVLAGAGHVMLDGGILDSVRSRSAASQALVLPYPQDGSARSRADLLKKLRQPATAALADYFWLLY